MKPAATIVGMLLGLAAPAAADTLDAPSVARGRVVVGARGAEARGAITREHGFPAHVVTAPRDGLLAITLVTTGGADANRGRAWRPYLRVLAGTTPARRGEGWSTNGELGDATRGRASLLVRVRARDELTVIATLAADVAAARPVAEATYALAVAYVEHP